MVRNKKPSSLGTSLTSLPRRPTGTMDDFVSTPAELQGARTMDKMASVSPGIESSGDSLECSNREDALAQIRQELAMISEHMLTKANTGGPMQEFRMAVLEEITTLRTDLATVEVRVEALETEAQASRTQHRAAELATTRQGNLLVALRCQVEDLENRSNRHNIRIRGLPEPVSTPLPETVRALFKQILGRGCPTDISLTESTEPWAHRGSMGSP
ncbi:Hypothetical predicted protein [Pelobates cultripes]|uniref:Uncharacterized protein n=1 Tax=Pelobates cultripes TaxID=61616 RepID=A0AAD1REH2_PELCU|nr:Hypothetical predicted protein [Pelobates cultripes]